MTIYYDIVYNILNNCYVYPLQLFPNSKFANFVYYGKVCPLDTEPNDVMIYFPEGVMKKHLLIFLAIFIICGGSALAEAPQEIIITEEPVVSDIENTTEITEEPTVTEPVITATPELEKEASKDTVAKPTKISGEFEYSQSTDSVSITAYKGKSKKVSIPEKINGVLVDSIADGAFQNSDVEEVVLPEVIKSIGSKAFRGCEELSYINLPGSIANIGDDAFEDCHSLLAFVSEYSFAYGYCLQQNIQYQCIIQSELN